MQKGFTVFVGDVGPDLAAEAKKYDSLAILVDLSNLRQVLDRTDITVYTSIGDFNGDTLNFVKLLNRADQIYYAPPEIWSDHEQESKASYSINSFESMKYKTMFVLNSINKSKQNVYNFNFEEFDAGKYLHLADIRKSELPQMWVAGCSYSHGIGVEPNQRYGQLVANRLNLPVSFLTAQGSSIVWAANQLLRSDIRAGDTVIWGLTSEMRFPIATNDVDMPIAHVTGWFNKHDKTSLSKKTINEMILDKSRIYDAITSVAAVVNFCKKIQAKLLIVGLLSSIELASYLNNFKEFIQYINLNTLNPTEDFKDLGNDNFHPGPEQHQLYADFILEHLKRFNLIQHSV